VRRHAVRDGVTVVSDNGTELTSMGGAAPAAGAWRRRALYRARQRAMREQAVVRHPGTYLRGNRPRGLAPGQAAREP